MTTSAAIKVQPWVVPILLSILLAIGGSVVRNEVRFAQISAKVDGKDERISELVDNVRTLRINVTSALDVAAQHGEELNQIRAQNLNLESRLNLLDKKIDERAADRFTFTQWSSEKATLLRLMDARHDEFRELKKKVTGE